MVIQTALAQNSRSYILVFLLSCEHSAKCGMWHILLNKDLINLTVWNVTHTLQQMEVLCYNSLNLYLRFAWERNSFAGKVNFSCIIITEFNRIERQALQKSVCSLVFLISSTWETHRMIPRWNHARSCCGAGKQQRIEHSNRERKFYSQNTKIIKFSRKTVAFPYKNV